MHYAFFLEHLYFSFQFYLVLFAAINGWTPTNFFWSSFLAFYLPRTLRFSLLSFNECSLFLELRLVYVFRLDFCSDLDYLCIKVYLDLWSMLVFIRRVVQKGSNVVGKEKKFHAKNG
jgi:hypothetical protein